MYLLNFVIGIFAAVYVLKGFWNHLETWQISLYIYYLILGFCGVAIACWIMMDGKQIEHCTVEIRNLERRLLDLEGQIGHIKTVELSNDH